MAGKVAVLVLLAVLAVACTPERDPVAGPPSSEAPSAEPAPPAPPSPSPSPSTAPAPAAEDLTPPTQQELVACIAGEGDLLGRLGARPVEARDAPGQVAEITDRMEDLRDLEQGAELAPQFLSDEAIEARTAELLLGDYPADEADLDRRLLAALGAVPPDIDLRAVQADLLSGQIAGFYESESNELVVRSGDPAQPLGPSEQSTLAHELVHAVTDSAFDLDRIDRATGDEATAFVALVEGDAVLAQQRFAIEAFDLAQQQALATDPEIAAAAEQLASFPRFLVSSLEFSYTEGLAFVCDRYADGGWDAVDDAYRQPPLTSVEILFPDRYLLPAAEPRAVPAPGGGWREARSETLGAADLLWLFSAPGDDPAAALDDPRGRVADWRGGRFALYTDGDATALGVALVGGGGGDGPTLCDSVRAWYDAAFPGDAHPQQGVVSCTGDEVRLGIAPDLATAQGLAG